MDFEELAWHVNRRYEDLMEQKRLQEQQAKKLAAQARVKRR
jgi:hypothetical protein